MRRRSIRHALTAAAAFWSALGVRAQPLNYVEPEIRVQSLSRAVYAHIEEDEVAVVSVDEFSRLRSRGPSEELAIIQIEFNGNWFRSADYLAREKAAAMGANALILVSSSGLEERGAGASSVYRAYRLTDVAGRPAYTKPPPAAPTSALPVEAAVMSPGASAPPPDPISPAVPVAVPVSAPRKHRHFSWVWEENPSRVSHRLGFDPAKAPPEQREQLRRYVEENFPPVEKAKLKKAYKTRSRIILDLVGRTIR